MKTVNVCKEFIDTIDEELDIMSAFVWEGSSSYSIQSHEKRDDKVDVLLSVSGNSMVEHSGDIDGIYDQVNDLKDSICSISWFGYKFNVEIISARIDYKEEDSPQEDEDYSVYVKGNVLLRVTDKELKTFKFTSTMSIEAYDEDEAKQKFADNSIDFAANAECEEVKNG